MISRTHKWLLVAFSVMVFSGCTPENPQEPINTPSVIKMPADDTTPRQKISLGTALFSGKIVLDASKITKNEKGFSVPVFLEGTGSDSALDTMSLKLSLPEAVSLSGVLNPTGFSAEIEGIASKNPVVYFHGNGADSSTISSSENPIFSLVFEGKASGEMAVRGGFFFRNATLKQTNRALLRLEQ